jgi:hypothetical protein
VLPHRGLHFTQRPLAHIANCQPSTAPTHTLTHPRTSPPLQSPTDVCEALKVFDAVPAAREAALDAIYAALERCVFPVVCHPQPRATLFFFFHSQPSSVTASSAGWCAPMIGGAPLCESLAARQQRVSCHAHNISVTPFHITSAIPNPPNK